MHAMQNQNWMHSTLTEKYNRSYKSGKYLSLIAEAKRETNTETFSLGADVDRVTHHTVGQLTVRELCLQRIAISFTIFE